MGKVILGLTVSIDGFIEDINRSINPLYEDLESLKETEYLNESILTTGAVIMAKKEFEAAEDQDLYADHYEYQSPTFVLTDKMPDKHPKENDNFKVIFITSGIEDAIKQAKIAAKDKDVNIIGSALTTQLCLNTNLIDELQIDIIPIFLKEGYKPFENIKNQNIKLERILTIELPEGRTHIRYKIN